MKSDSPSASTQLSGQDVKSPQPAGAAVRGPVFPDGPINILIVDDEPKNLTVLETVLDDPAYRLVRAESADQALLSLVVEEFALLILDIRMPGMTGFELAHMIKERKKTARVPIIFLTAYYNEDQHVLDGYGSGAVDYLHKPVNAAILRSKVAVFAELHYKNRECGIANRALLAEVGERRRAQEQLRELNETLEQRVIERTDALVAARAALNETGDRYRSLFDSSLDAIFSLSEDGHFETANPAAVQLTGRTLETLKTVRFKEICSPDRSEETDKAFRGALSNKRITIDTTIITVNGEHRDLFVSVAPAVVNGQVLGVSCIARDVTERKQTERAMIKASAAKDEFLAVLSHELRTPLAPVRVAISMWERRTEEFPADFQPDLAMMRRNVDLECRLIDDMLDLNRIIRGKLELQVGPVDLNVEIRHAMQTVGEDAASKRIGMKFEPFSPQSQVLGDAARLQQVFWNLLKNAVKFTEPGGSVTVRTYSAAPNRICVEVRDTGDGIEPECISQIFNAFEQGGSRITRQFGGLGLGLAISKGLVERHGGKLVAQSEGKGRGATFTLDLELSSPLAGSTDSAIVPSANRDSGVPKAGPSKRILLVEDHEDTAQIMKRLLRSLGYNVNVAGSVAGALEEVESNKFDLVISDLGLPDGSGYQLMRELLARAPTKGIALSGYGRDEDVKLGEDAGFAAHLTKPINIRQLELAIQRVIGNPSTRELNANS